MIGIYEIINLINNKSYIGSSSDISRRFLSHQSKLKNLIHPNTHLQNAWNKYGENAFEFRILEACKKDELLEKEQEWLDFYRFNNLWDLLYNIRIIVSSNLGISFSEESRKRISKAQKGKIISDSTREKMSKAAIGRKKPQGFQDGIKNHRYGTKLSPEKKEKFLLAGIANKVKTFKFTNPSGQIIEITNLSKFCREYNLSSGHMCHVYHGKRNHHKGWRRINA